MIKDYAKMIATFILSVWFVWNVILSTGLWVLFLLTGLMVYAWKKTKLWEFLSYYVGKVLSPVVNKIRKFVPSR